MSLDYLEGRRLAALGRARTLDARGEEALERIVRCVAEAFDVPIATISLLDETRQINLARHGIDIRSFPRENAFCNRTIDANRTVVALDASLDPVWQDNPFVTGEAHLRFYAGVPLRLDAQPIGTLCVMDTEPHNRFGERERERLERYADLVLELLDLHLLRAQRTDAEERFERMAAACPDAMIIVDERGAIRFWNEGSTRLFGHSPQDALGLTIADLLPPRQRPEAGEFRALFDPCVGRTQEIEALLKDGTTRIVEFSLARWQERGHLFYGGILRDISERRRNEAELHRLAHHDVLTELPNRAVLRHRLGLDLASGRGAALLLVDLDGFKDVNDRLGHAAGDVILRETAQRLLHCVRPTDTVTRFGGDEFAILLHGCLEPAEAGAVAERIVASIEQPFTFEGGALRLGASVGVAFGPAQAERIDDLLSCADLALYRAKSDGRHCHRFYTPTLRAATDERRRYRHDIRRAMADGEFVLHYQPQVRLSDGELTGAEALIRWHHPEEGLLLPPAFLPSVDGGRDEQALGDWVLATACRQAALWQHKAPARFRMAVNACASRLRNGVILESVRGALAASGLSPEHLELEITENTILRNDERIVADLAALRALGVSIAFDDYGTGFASLSLLKRFPLTRLKIDRSFVQELSEGADEAVVQAILQLADAFGLGVIAEGIETDEQRRRLRGWNCLEGQGFLFSEALPAAEFERRFL